MTADMRSPAPAATGNGASIDKNKAEGFRSTKQSKRRQAAKAFFEGAAQLSPTLQIRRLMRNGSSGPSTRPWLILTSCMQKRLC